MLRTQCEEYRRRCERVETERNQLERDRAHYVTEVHVSCWLEQVVGLYMMNRNVQRNKKSPLSMIQLLFPVSFTLNNSICSVI